MACSSVSARWMVYPMVRSPPNSVSRPAWAKVSRHCSITRSVVPPEAAPPPMMPLMPCFTMKSMALWLALTTGCQHSTGKVRGLGTKVISFRS